MIEGKYGDVCKDIEKGIVYAHDGEKWIPESEISDVFLMCMIALWHPEDNEDSK